ncbi:hypothetical protein EVAR_43837_1 [Eumeta japonica]|uniref:Uncharacterized protein n=1 Tax=Eumeta variegata TaxID=151549 RepID=A0A4C1X139_EUMVA|nr:hypothetical protein EVAR_43837_1 [Eumeta japonica]
MLRGGKAIVANLLYQLFNKCRKSHRVPSVKQSLYPSIKGRLTADLEKAYDRAKRNHLWRTIFMHDASSGLIQAPQSSKDPVLASE